MPATVLTGAKLLDGVATNVLITDGTITALGPHTEAPDGADTVDLTGYVLLPSAVEPHAHLDKAFLAELVINETGDLYGAIEAMKASRHLTNVTDTIERAERAARLMAANGFSAVRSHADTTLDNRLESIEALVEVKRRVADVIDLEIVTLSSWPITGPAGASMRTAETATSRAQPTCSSRSPPTTAAASTCTPTRRVTRTPTGSMSSPGACWTVSTSAPPPATASASASNRSRSSERRPSGWRKPASAS
jgi:cytosine deaminase